MNSDIIPQGDTETVTDGAITRPVLLFTAETDCVISAIVYLLPADPPNPTKVTAFTLKTGRWLANVKSVAFTGTATAIYRV